MCCDIDYPDFKFEVDPFDLLQFQETMRIISKGPYRAEKINEDRIEIYDKDVEFVLAFGKNWIEKA